MSPGSRLNKGVESKRLTGLAADSRLSRGWHARTDQPPARWGDFFLCPSMLLNNIHVYYMFTTALHIVQLAWITLTRSEYEFLLFLHDRSESINKYQEGWFLWSIFNMACETEKTDGRVPSQESLPDLPDRRRTTNSTGRHRCWSINVICS